MIEFRFGDIVTMDYEPAMRLMALCPAQDGFFGKNPLRPGAWWAVVLTDTTWAVGLIVTARPDAAGVRVIERAEAL